MATDPSTPLDAARKLVERRKHAITMAEKSVATARGELEDTLRLLADDGYSYRELGELAGFTKQHAGDLVKASRARG